MIRLILGLDPGLRHTGWGLVAQEGNRLSFVAAGRISPNADLPMASRLLALAEGPKYCPIITSLFRSRRSKKPLLTKTLSSALKLGQARGAAMLTLAQAGLNVTEYAANRIKQSVTGYGHADKAQIQTMIGMLLPGSGKLAPDAADALAVAITHAHHRDIVALKVKA